MYSLGTMREYSAFGGDHSRSFRSYSTDHSEEQVNNMRERERESIIFMMLSFQESNTVITFDDLKEETIGKQRLSLIPTFIQ